MINFFRKIRQKMLIENKFSKYLIYAIGEIILVVIGILIALNVNNLNEEKKDLLSALTLIDNLNEEIEQDSIYFNNVYNAEKNIFLNSAELLFNVHSNIEYDIQNDSIMSMAFRFASFTPVIKFSDNTYNELTSSNLLKKLNSEKLKNYLHEYYSQIKFLNLYSEHAQSIRNDLIDELANYYIVIPPEHTESRKLISFSGAGEVQFLTKYDLVSFRENKSLNPKLYDMIDIHMDRLGGLEIVKNLGHRIREEIQKIKENN